MSAQRVFSVLVSILISSSMAAMAQSTSLPEKKVKSETSQNHAGGDSAAEGYHFNTLGIPANTDRDNRNGFKFKAPDAGAQPTDISADPVNNKKNDAPFEAYPGYPKHSFGLAWAPQSIGFTETYGSGPDFNFSTTSMTAFALDYRFIASPIWQFELEYMSYPIKATSQSLSPYTINESTTNLDSLMVRIQYCSIGDNARARFCPILEVGEDSFASFEFGSSGLDLDLSRAQDTVIGPSLLWMYPTTPFWTLKAKVGYLYGLKLGQNSNLTLKDDSRITSGLGMERDLSNGHFFEGFISYDYRSAKLEGKVGSVTDSWKTTYGDLALKLGYRYEFN